MEFTRRLHGAEVERRDLRAQNSQLLAEKQQWVESGATPEEIELMQKKEVRGKEEDNIAR